MPYWEIKLIINTDKKRILQGSHCFSTALCRISNHYTDMNLTEDMVFGLASGLDFLYRRENDAICLNGRANDIEKKYASCMGISFKQISAPTFNQFIVEVIDYLKRGEWLLLYLDASKLPYIQLGLDMQDVGMMSEHAGILCGVDEDKEVFYVLDYMLAYEAEVPFELMRQALYNDSPKQFSQERSECLKNTYGYFSFSHSSTPRDIKIYSAIEANCSHMIYPTNKYQGLMGLKNLGREFPLWREMLPHDQLCKEMASAYAYLEKIGTGGGNFRRMYARFLREASTICRKPQFEDLSKEYFAVSRMWKMLALNLYRLSEEFDDNLFKQQKQIILDLHERESELIGILSESVVRG